MAPSWTTGARNTCLSAGTGKSRSKLPAVHFAAFPPFSAQVHLLQSKLSSPGNILLFDALYVACSWVSLNSIAADAAHSLPDGSAALADNVQNDVVSLFQEAQTSGFNAVRLFAHGGDVNFQLQVSPGVLRPTFQVKAHKGKQAALLQSTHGLCILAGKYNESVFRGIDYILALAGKYQVKVMLNCQDTFHGA